MTRRPLFTALLATTALFGIIPAANAQIEEIVVTTRKRAENLQDVPIVIQALTAETIARKGIASIEDITKYTPGVSLEEGFTKQDTRITIRGLSPTRGRQNVAVLKDDIDLSSEAIATAGGSFFINPRLFDVERIEVVKGPHSALYGRSAFAGAINYITKKPGDTFDANIGAEFGTHGKQEGRLSVSGPVVTDKLSIGVNAAAWNYNGEYKNTVTGRNVGGYDGAGGSATAVFKPNDVLKFTLRGEYSKDHFDTEARTFISPSAVSLTLPASATFLAPSGSTTAVIPYTGVIPDAAGLAPVRMSANPRTPGVDYPGTDRKLRSVYLRSEANFDQVSVISLTYFANNDVTQFTDTLAQGDASTVNAIQETHFVTNNKTWNQDLRLQSNDVNSRLSWSFGGLFWNERTQQEGQSNVCASTVGGCVNLLSGLGVSRGYFIVPNTYTRNTHHYSIYGTLSFKVTDALSVEAEARKVWETEHINAPITSTLIGCVGGQRLIAPPGTPIRCIVPAPQGTTPTVTAYGKTTTKDGFWTPRVSVNYKLNPDVMVYVSAANGKKPAGSLSLTAPTLVAGTADFTGTKFIQEKLWVYELGAKTELFDKRVRLNGDVYYQSFKNKQETGTRTGADGLPIPGSGFAEKARTWGFEADGTFLLNEHLVLTAGYSYIDAKYQTFNLQQTTLSNIALAGNCTRPNATANYCVVNYSGKSLVLSPKHSFNIGGEYRAPVGNDLDVVIDVDTKYMGKRFADVANATILNSYWVADLRVGLQAPKWSITAYCDNVTDNDTLKSGIVNLPDFNTGFISGGVAPQSPGLASGTLASLPEKRQFGVRASYKF